MKNYADNASSATPDYQLGHRIIPPEFRQTDTPQEGHPVAPPQYYGTSPTPPSRPTGWEALQPEYIEQPVPIVYSGQPQQGPFAHPGYNPVYAVVPTPGVVAELDESSCLYREPVVVGCMSLVFGFFFGGIFGLIVGALVYCRATQVARFKSEGDIMMVSVKLRQMRMLLMVLIVVIIVQFSLIVVNVFHRGTMYH